MSSQGCLPRTWASGHRVWAGVRDQSQGHGEHVARACGHVGEGAPDPACCPQGSWAPPLGEARCCWHGCPGFLLLGAGTPIGEAKMPLAGQGHPSQDTMTLLSCRARTGMLCPAMPHSAQLCSGQHPQERLPGHPLHHWQGAGCPRAPRLREIPPAAPRPLCPGLPRAWGSRMESEHGLLGDTWCTRWVG